MTSKPSSQQIRQTFVDYFKRQGHSHVGSSSLIPENDPTLLFANAGMNQFKNAFLGVEKRDYSRAVTVQKCVRAGGKHNDLDNVGFTARHHTFFEMLGNFSFGDYFKKDAIHFAWELLTKDFAIPKDKLYVTVFQTDDEAADIWHKQEGVPKDRIFRLGEKDNFWRMGDTGPCGPCTEIFYDHGPRAGKIADPFKGIVAGEDRFVEIWNLVFMQFYERAPGQMEPLPKPSVDTGSGLERVVAALQGKLNNYDTDLFAPLIEVACAKAGWDFEKLLKLEDQGRGSDGGADERVRQQMAALRVLADHVRSGSFLIADGALPSNEGRGYVLRRILRRAIRFGRQVLPEGSLILPMSQKLIENMSNVYPELKARKDIVLETLEGEEQRFLQTLDKGVALLEEALQKTKGQTLPGAVAFKLYDTYGFPLDLTQLMAAEKGIAIDEKGFDEEMEKARKLAKESWRGKGLEPSAQHLLAWSQSIKDSSGPTEFTGYQSLQGSARVLGLFDGQKAVSSLAPGAQGFVALASTPFYAEGGGQVGDRGHFEWNGGRAVVHHTLKSNDLHIHEVLIEGTHALSVGATLQAKVESSERRETANNHSATHLMHAALRMVLGTHVTQQGSLVDSEKLRFDFSHSKALTTEEIRQIEDLVNEQIAASLAVTAEKMTPPEAIKKGALALFGEKYGSEVRVLSMGDFSMELCGGTHVSNTSQIRMFLIVSESGVSSGVRRIEALTGARALEFLQKHRRENLLAREATGHAEGWSAFLQSQKSALDWIETAKNQIKDLQKELRKSKSATVNPEDLLKTSRSFAAKGGSSKVVAAQVGIDDREALSQLADQLKNKVGSGIVVLLGEGADSRPLIVSVSKDLNPDFKAGDLLREVAAALGGKGGGRPDFAQGAVPPGGAWAEADRTLAKILKIQ